MPQVMPLAKSRERAREVFLMREVDLKSWSKCRDALGFKSIGAAQMAYTRYLQRNPMPDAASTRAGIVERKRHTLGVALASLAAAAADGDHPAVARLVDTITKVDSELAKLYGLSRETVDVNVRQTPAAIIDRMENELLALVDAQDQRSLAAPPVIEGEVIG
jgi:hypothetical protein